MKKLESEIRKAYQELPSTEKHTRIKGTHEGFAYEAIKNSRFIAIGWGKSFGIWCKGDSMHEIEKKLHKGLKGFIVYGADTPCPLWCNDFGGVGTIGLEHKDVNIYVAYDNRYKSDKTKLPTEEILSEYETSQDTAHTIIFEDDGVQDHCNVNASK
tara:strand:+ start:989 stop:1456 length:468 start_codon:yes stop_codon:yes gene_type:complete